jgi:ketosteroid isomerase-like protein
MPTTQTVLDHHLQCFGKGDLAGIMADYTELSAILTPDAAIKGLDAIRQFFAAAFQEFGKPGTTFEMRAVRVEGDCAFIVWDADTPDNKFESATDTFVVREGKILVQTYAAKVTPKGATARA